VVVQEKLEINAKDGETIIHEEIDEEGKTVIMVLKLEKNEGDDDDTSKRDNL
jgi:hypothetical protein